MEVVFPYRAPCVEYTAELKTHLIQTTMHAMLEEDAKPTQLAIGVSLVHSMAAPSLCLRVARAQHSITSTPPTLPPFLQGRHQKASSPRRPGRPSRNNPPSHREPEATHPCTGCFLRGESATPQHRLGVANSPLPDAQPVGPPVQAGQAASRVLVTANHGIPNVPRSVATL